MWILATGAGDIKSRLLAASIEFGPVQTRDIPDGLRADYEWIRAALTKRKAKYGEGTIRATLHGMHRATGVKIAERICALAYALEEY